MPNPTKWIVLVAAMLAMPRPPADAGEIRAGEDPKSRRSVERMDFGKTPDGTPVELYELTNGRITAKVMTYGGIVTELHVPDRRGNTADVALGFETLDAYIARNPHFGAITGRVANRIAGASFTLDGKEYKLAANNGPNSLHSGPKGFDKVVWKAEDVSGPDGPAVKLTYRSPDGEGGFPGNLSVAVTYTVTQDDALKIDYSATTDKPTLVNLTNHSYFNLAGQTGGTILDHEMMIAADQYTAADDAYIPTGELKSVQGTPLDFTSPKALGARIAQIKGEPGGYDHNYVIRPDKRSPALAARVREPSSGRVMEVFTTEPGVQLYTGNFLDGSVMGKGVVYKKHTGFCLETQHFPDSPHHPEFPSIVLRPGATYKTTTIYKFSAP
jgi:aldose 1-epimerase